MNTKRVYYAMVGLVVVLFLGVLVGTLQVNKLLEAKSKQLVDLKLKSQVVASQQVGLQTAKKQIQLYSGFEATAKAIVPQDKDQAQAVREIAKLAAESGITRLSSVTFPVSTLGGTAAASGAAASGSASSSASSSAKTSLTQLTPVKGNSAGLYSLQITIQQTTEAAIPYSQFLTFLEKLEQNRRTAQVTSIVLQPDTARPNMVAFTLVINEFIKP